MKLWDVRVVRGSSGKTVEVLVRVIVAASEATDPTVALMEDMLAITTGLRDALREARP